MIFQSYILYPLMKAFDNMTSVVKTCNIHESMILRNVSKIAEFLRPTLLLDRKPWAAQWARAQRKTVGRVIVRDLRVSNLDAPHRATNINA
jgi:multiple sugar transport system ATP-binding protein